MQIAPFSQQIKLIHVYSSGQNFILGPRLYPTINFKNCLKDNKVRGFQRGSAYHLNR